MSRKKTEKDKKVWISTLIQMVAIVVIVLLLLHLCHWNHLCEGFIHGAKLPPWRIFW